ncbi:MAG: prolipoprotein diacylglyceryl transferase [Candidatus Lokiarchaeota archaeon]|nr:prolipoprotein diacylglyceryl transferase [Candidatus Harpocratesius repetitus]
MNKKVEKIFSYLIKPFLSLNKNPILYKGKNFQIVNFGLIMVVSIFFSNSLLLFYLNSKGIYFNHPTIVPLGIMLFSMLFFTKFFQVFIDGLKYFENFLYNLNQTTMYNQGGLMGIGIGAIIVCWMEHINIIIFLDAVTFGATLSLFIGRIGCYNYGCCYGKPTNGSFSVKYSNMKSKVIRINPELLNVPLYPTQLVASLFNLFLFILGLIYVSFFDIDGVILVSFLILYNLFRYFSQQKRASAKNRVFSRTAIVYLLSGILLLFVSIIFRNDFYTQTPFITRISLVNYIKGILLNFDYMATMSALSVVTFLFYGVHGRKLGQYVGG